MLKDIVFVAFDTLAAYDVTRERGDLLPLLETLNPVLSSDTLPPLILSLPKDIGRALVRLYLVFDDAYLSGEMTDQQRKGILFLLDILTDYLGV